MLFPNSLDEFARRIGLPKYMLCRYAYGADSYYKQFRVKKRTRGQRVISAPSKELKGVQNWIKTFLLTKFEISEYATGYVAGKSIVTNAEIHIGQDFVCNLDLKDFFPSIKIGRLVHLFVSEGCSSEIAVCFAKILTYKGSLPQGAPTSPVISNIVLNRLDRRLSRLCQSRDFAYSRYCDDLTISGSRHIDQRFLDIVTDIIKFEGFELNQQKTRILRKNVCQEVTGLIVNSKVDLLPMSRKRIRAIFHQAKVRGPQFMTRLSELQGYLAHLQNVSPYRIKEISEYRSVVNHLRLLQGQMPLKDRAELVASSADVGSPSQNHGLGFF